MSSFFRMQMGIQLCHLTSNSSVHPIWDHAPIIGSSQLNSRHETNSTKYLSTLTDIMTLDTVLYYGSHHESFHSSCQMFWVQDINIRDISQDLGDLEIELSVPKFGGKKCNFLQRTSEWTHFSTQMFEGNVTQALLGWAVWVIGLGTWSNSKWMGKMMALSPKRLKMIDL